MRLNEQVIRALETPDKAHRIWYDGDIPGFGMRVTKAGARSFVLNYWIEGRERRLTIGSWPSWTATAARNRAKELRREIEQGLDPLGSKEQRRAAPTFADVAGEYLEKHASTKKSGDRDAEYLKRDVLPNWGGRKAEDIKRRDIIALVDAKAATAPVAANRLLACVRKVFNWAISRDLLETNPCIQVRAPGVERRRDRVLSEHEMLTFWQALDQADEITATVKSSLRLILVTAQRPGEVCEMEWADIDGAWWTVPADKAKNGLSHRVPLAELALAELEPYRDSSRWVFRSRRGDKPVQANALAAAVRRQNCFGLPHFTPHDLRRSAATGMGSLGVHRFVLARVLNHVESGVTSVYDRASYDGDKHKALAKWDRKLRAIISGEAPAKVVAIDG